MDFHIINVGEIKSFRISDLLFYSELNKFIYIMFPYCGYQIAATQSALTAHHCKTTRKVMKMKTTREFSAFVFCFLWFDFFFQPIRGRVAIINYITISPHHRPPHCSRPKRKRWEIPPPLKPRSD